MFLNKFPKKPFPLICLIEINLDFNLLQILQVPITYGLSIFSYFTFDIFRFCNFFI